MGYTKNKDIRENMKNKWGISFLLGSFFFIIDNSHAMKIDDKFPFTNKNAFIVDNEVNLNGNSYIRDYLNNGELTMKQLTFSENKEKEMLSWMLLSKPKRFILVNISSFMLYVVEYKNNEYNIIWETKVVVGASTRQTPQETLSITSLKYNPDWSPTPEMIKRNAKLSNNEWNWAWIRSHQLNIFLRSTGEKIDWNVAKNISLSNIYMVQSSGENNSLGRIKFDTNSKSNIYLHDTNEKKYFDRKQRSFSSGCIRVQNPEILASLLANTSVDEIEKNIKRKKTFWTRVEKTPVYFLYDIIDYKQGGYDQLELMYDPYGLFKKFNSKDIQYKSELIKDDKITDIGSSFDLEVNDSYLENEPNEVYIY